MRIRVVNPSATASTTAPVAAATRTVPSLIARGPRKSGGGDSPPRPGTGMPEAFGAAHA
jgi:hypothetical protein